MAKIELYVAVDISDDAAAILDASDDNGAVGLVANLVRNSLVSVPGFRKVTVDVAEVAGDDGEPESDGDEIDSAPATRVPNKGQKSVSGARTAHSAPVHKSGDRPGRPATLHNLRASDGEPVRSFGPRSREVLEDQGITVWDVDKGETGPVVKAKNTGQRTEPVRAGKPAVMKRRG